MTPSRLHPPITDQTAAALLNQLADQRDALYADAVPDHGEDWREAQDQHSWEEVQLIARQARIYADATGRCAEHLTFHTRWDAGRPCRNRAKPPAAFCGVHDPGWEHRYHRAQQRVAANARLAETRKVADALRAHDLDAHAGTDHVTLTADDARRLVADLAELAEYRAQQLDPAAVAAVAAEECQASECLGIECMTECSSSHRLAVFAARAQETA